MNRFICTPPLPIGRVAICCVLLALGSVGPSRCFAHDVTAEMRQAAERLLTSLNLEQRQQVSLPFESEKRMGWHFIPSSMMSSHGGRRGLEIKRMTAQQREFAIALLNTALSHHGQLQATTIRALETILRDLENGNSIRDSEMYHVAVYGTPTADHTWGWSFEGHHLSVNLMLIDGTRFSVTPSFWGSNPAIVKNGPFQGLETLSIEQQLARKLVRSLNEDQKKMAIIATKAPRDVITGAERKVNQGVFHPPQGISFQHLNENQQVQLLKLVREFAAKYRQPIVEQIAQRNPIVDGTGMFFAWAGSMEEGEGHYYRIQTPAFLFEYDNTQSKANHVHTVWRSFDGDFGEDLLLDHYQHGHHRED